MMPGAFVVLSTQGFPCPDCKRAWVFDGRIAIYGWETRFPRHDGAFLCCGNR